MTRRFDIGPVVLALGALVVLVALFLDWFATFNAWQVFEIVDVILAALAVAALAAAIGLLVPEMEFVEGKYVPWLVGAAWVLVADQIVQPPAGLDTAHLGTGAWLALAGSVVMVLGAVLSLTKVSFAVAVEGRDRRRRVSAVDHRPPPTESGAPVARSSTSLLNPDPPEAGEKT